MRKYALYRVAAIITLFGSPFVSNSQDTTNMGTEFWVGYGHHQFMEQGVNAQNMVLYFSTGNQPAVVNVVIDSSGVGTNPSTWWYRVYNIPANTVASIENFAATTYSSSAGSMGAIPKGVSGQYDARLYSSPYPGGSNSTGLFRRKGIKITSDVPIAVHTHIYGSTSSGATMVLPVQAWGYTYYSVNSKQNYASNCFSWLFVIAKEDSTVVEITPSILTHSQNLTGLQPGVPKTILLQKGQIYQVMGANDGASANGIGGSAATAKELTGTKVKALIKGRPIGVFAGSSRTNNIAACGSGGGDNDIVQLFPLHIWGKKYLTAPTSGSNGPSSFSTNGYKIIVHDPATVVKRNGITLNALVNNSYYTFESSMPEYIEADKPIMVAQFMLGGACNTGGQGDPDMYYLSPLDGGLKKVNGIRTNNEAILTNDLLLVVSTAALPSLRIDGSAVFDYSYPHPRLPGYTVVIKRWTASLAKFTAECDSTFTGITYGMGAVESYGFNIGAKFIPLHGIDPMFRMRWLGTESSDWKTGANWSTGTVPTAEDHLFISSGTPHNLIIEDNVEVTCKSIELENGVSITVKPSAILNIKN